MRRVVHAAKRYEWERIVRRCLIKPSAKHVALTLATYADKDGSHVHPSVQRLEAVTGLSKRSVLRALEVLRQIGLIDRTFSGSSAGRRGLADEYQLTIPEDLLEVVKMLPPDEQKQGAEASPDGGAEQGADVARARPGTGAIRGLEQVPPVHEQVPPVHEQVPYATGTGDTWAPPPTQDQPSTNSEDHSALRERALADTRAVRRCEHGFPIAVDGWSCGSCAARRGAAA